MKRYDLLRLLQAIPKDERKSLSLMDVKQGGFLKLEKTIYYVEQLSKYLETKWEKFTKKKNDYFVTELTLVDVETGEKKYVEWEYDDELEIYETVKTLKMRDFRCHGERVNQSILEDIAEEEEGVITYNGKNFYYSEDDTWAAKWFKDEETKTGIPVRFFEFSSDDDDYLTIEVWYDTVSADRGEKEAFLSKDVSVKQIEILQLEAKE